MAAVRGIGVAVITSTSGTTRPATLFPECGPLLDAEAVLLVDHHHAEGPEGHRLGEQGVGADQHVDGPLGQAGVEAGPLLGRGPVGQQRHRQRPVRRQGAARSAT